MHFPPPTVLVMVQLDVALGTSGSCVSLLSVTDSTSVKLPFLIVRDTIVPNDPEPLPATMSSRNIPGTMLAISASRAGSTVEKTIVSFVVPGAQDPLAITLQSVSILQPFPCRDGIAAAEHTYTPGFLMWLQKLQVLCEGKMLSMETKVSSMLPTMNKSRASGDRYNKPLPLSLEKPLSSSVIRTRFRYLWFHRLPNQSSKANVEVDLSSLSISNILKPVIKIGSSSTTVKSVGVKTRGALFTAAMVTLILNPTSPFLSRALCAMPEAPERPWSDTTMYTNSSVAPVYWVLTVATRERPESMISGMSIWYLTARTAACRNLESAVKPTDDFEVS
mmetsp:Transcript_39170/g.91234  ORF Transcript_39170/g.91234 Transcript_39170/m.91234 type:complete len:334 (-) Transcript_39170:1047-2048(-)